MDDILYMSGLTPDGTPLMAGIFRIHDEIGFPVDMTYEICKEKKQCPDWLEYLADAGSQKQWKFDAAVKEMQMLIGEYLTQEILSKFKFLGALMTKEGDNFISICEKIVNTKKKNRIIHNPEVIIEELETQDTKSI